MDASGEAEHLDLQSTLMKVAAEPEDQWPQIKFGSGHKLHVIV